MTPVIDISRNNYRDIWKHLHKSRLEEAAFAYAEAISEGGSRFKINHWSPVSSEGFIYQTDIGFELFDEARASAIKTAHDLTASLVEFHSHKGGLAAKFSASDLYGFTEFVPHVWWRLKGRPYFAFVVTETGFDAFVWMSDPTKPEYLHALSVGRDLLTPTKLSPLSLIDYDYEYTF